MGNSSCPEDDQDCQLTINPSTQPAAKKYKEALYEEGILGNCFASKDLSAEVNILKSKGVIFKTEPKDIGSAWVAVFNNSCGNWIQLHRDK